MQRPREFLPGAGKYSDCRIGVGAAHGGSLGRAAEAEAAEANQTERAQHDHPEGGGRTDPGFLSCSRIP